MGIRPTPCEGCPYRRDVPSGVWAKHEYEKLRDYDNPTYAQPLATFACHASPRTTCNGWAIVHTNQGNEYDLLALRIFPVDRIPNPVVPLFLSGNEAADHGERDIATPGLDALRMINRLTSKHERLSGGARALTE